ncbi:adh short, KR, NAD binding 10, and/or Epimerase domain containing protein [Asbolus verrucosus]|uniref:Adh short, KR, NAD binding 10, and/or Epimerase domain containing protein n=1 Tax=Asbolus verrucosus TaxID=1661398 RepID=A0A482W2W1_ASBVE|nr:adh short, KR, NAD binding 10, and/or Epimerase domain containing protein [Asbolus verrucosus]
MVLSMERWIGKIAVVTGASSGIGAAIAGRLVKEGVKVAGLGRRVERIEENAKKLSEEKGELHAIKTDVTKEEDILNAFKWVADNLGPVSILINSAGIYRDPPLMSGKTEEWKAVIDTNVMGLCIATREAIKSMQANKIDGHILHINSYLGHKIPASPGLSIYATSKSAVTTLTETMRHELIAAGSKIKISSVSPGMVETEMTVFSKILSEERLNLLKQLASIKDEDVVDALIYNLSTPPHVQVHEMIIKPVGEMY